MVFMSTTGILDMSDSATGKAGNPGDVLASEDGAKALGA